jgi:hypothetical protein
MKKIALIYSCAKLCYQNKERTVSVTVPPCGKSCDNKALFQVSFEVVGQSSHREWYYTSQIQTKIKRGVVRWLLWLAYIEESRRSAAAAEIAVFV